MSHLRNTLFTLQKSDPPVPGFALTKVCQNFTFHRALEDLPCLTKSFL